MRKVCEVVVARWFDGLNQGDLEGLLPLFAREPRIRRAAHPVLEGPEAARLYLEDFFARTLARRFQLIDAAEGDEQLFAHWVALMTFAPGTLFEDVRLAKALTVTLRGVERFQLDGSDRIAELDIIHETSSLYGAARAVGRASGTGQSEGRVAYRQEVEAFFQAQAAGDEEGVVSLCAPEIIVRPVAEDPYHGREGVRLYVAALRERTLDRHFDLLAVAENGNVIFVWWRAELRFKGGVTFDAVVTKRPFLLQLHGISRFKIDETGHFSEVDIFHETSTALRLAQGAAH